MSLTSNTRNADRLRQIASVLARRGFDLLFFVVIILGFWLLFSVLRPKRR